MMTNEEVKAMMTDATVGRAYLALGIPANKAVTSYLKACVRFIDNADGSPCLQIVDHDSGVQHESVESLVRSLRSDPAFQPSARSAGGREPVQPVRVKVDDISSGRYYDSDLVGKVSRGEIGVEFPEEGRIEPQKGEVSIHDQAALNRNIEAIASGKIKVV